MNTANVQVIELNPADANPSAALEALLDRSGLRSSVTSLRSYPGSLHWHITKPGEKGTLECTWWPKTGRFWLAVHENRRANLQEQVIASLLRAFGSTS